MTRRNFKIDDLIGPHAIPCKYDCGTMLTFNREFKCHQEQWSNVIHSKYRCNYIKAKNKTEKEGFNRNVPRLDVVMELREVIDGLDEKTELVQQAYLLLRATGHKEKKPTKKEIALALFPTKFYIDENGNKQPTPESLGSTSSAVSRAKDKKGKYVGLIASAAKWYKEHRQYRYSDIKTKEEFKPVKDKAIKHAAGILESVKVMEQTIERDPIEREYKAREMEKEIRLGATNTNKKKKRGDSNNEGVL